MDDGNGEFRAGLKPTKPSFYVHLLGQNELLLDLWYLRNIGKSSDA